MAIMRTNDWHRLVHYCKKEIQNTEGDKRAARGLLFRLVFYISENRLVKPQRREKQEPAIQQPVFDNIFDRGVIEEEGTPLSPKEVDLKTKVYDHTQLGPGPYGAVDFGHPGCPVCEEARSGICREGKTGDEKEISE